MSDPEGMTMKSEGVNGVTVHDSQFDLLSDADNEADGEPAFSFTIKAGRLGQGAIGNILKSLGAALENGDVLPPMTIHIGERGVVKSE